MEEAAYLIEGRPPDGWGSIVTKEHLDLRVEAFEHCLNAKLTELFSSVDRRLRAQTWIMTGTLITGLGIALSVGQSL